MTSFKRYSLVTDSLTADQLPHQDQLPAQHSVTSMGSLLLFTNASDQVRTASPFILWTGSTEQGPT